MEPALDSSTFESTHCWPVRSMSFFLVASETTTYDTWSLQIQKMTPCKACCKPISFTQKPFYMKMVTNFPFPPIQPQITHRKTKQPKDIYLQTASQRPAHKDRFILRNGVQSWQSLVAHRRFVRESAVWRWIQKMQAEKRRSEQRRMLREASSPATTGKNGKLSNVDGEDEWESTERQWRKCWMLALGSI